MSQNARWHQTFYTYVWVFNTGRGLAICIRLPHNVGLMYDLGSSDEFSPTDFIRRYIAPKLTQYLKCTIAQCVLSHPHADHINAIDAVTTDEKTPSLHPHLLTCPNDKVQGEEVDFSRLVNEDNKELLDKYRAGYARRTPPLQTFRNDVPCTIPNVEYGFYYMVPPRVDAIHKASDQLYGNGLSLVLYVRHGNQTLLLPGDITPEVFEPVIDAVKDAEKRYTIFSQSDATGDWHTRTSNQPTLKTLLRDRGLSVLVAPHHGLESCFSKKLFESIRGGKPIINVVSEKRHLSESDGKVDARYQSKDGAFGLDVDIDGTTEKQRCSVSTRDGHHILVIFRGTDAAPRVYLRSNPEDLLEIV